MESVLTEVQAVHRAREGDASAYSVLLAQHQSVAFRAAYLILHDAAAAEDAVQDAFLRAYRSIGSFREEESFRPWLLRIVTNVALNELRSRRRKLGLLDRLARFLPRESPTRSEAIIVDGETAADVWQALHRLNERDRLVLYLRYFLEMDEREMAVALGMPAGTVKSRLHRARRRLREVIEKEFPDLRTKDD